MQDFFERRAGRGGVACCALLGLAASGANGSPSGDAPSGVASSAMPWWMLVPIVAVAAAILLRGRLLRLPRDVAPPASAGTGLVLGIGFFIVLLAAQLGAAVGLAISGARPLPGEPLNLAGTAALLAGQSIAGIGAAAAVVALLPDRRPTRFAARLHDLPLGALGLLLAWPIVALVSIAAVLVADAIARMRSLEPPGQVAHRTLEALADGGGPAWWMVIVLVVAFAPLLEEILYRGLLQGALREATGRPWLAIGATSVVFAVVHAGVADLHALPALFLLGVAFGVIVERTGRLGPAIAMHAIFNAANVLLALRG